MYAVERWRELQAGMQYIDRNEGFMDRSPSGTTQMCYPGRDNALLEQRETLLRISAKRSRQAVQMLEDG